jgi:hypothetical protein
MLNHWEARCHLTRVTSHVHLKRALLIGWTGDTSAAIRRIVKPQAASANELFPRGKFVRLA